MQRTAILAWAIGLGATIGPALAGPEKLADTSLHRAVAGKTVSIATPFGALPVSYRFNGTMSGSSTALATVTGVARDRGRWWVSHDKLCQRWNTWLDGKAHCVTLRQNGNTLHWVASDGKSGTATIAR